MMAVFFFIAHEKGFEFHVQPQTGAYSCLAKSPNGRGQKKAPPPPNGFVLMIILISSIIWNTLVNKSLSF